MKNKKLKLFKGFTLIELLVVIAIIGILGAIVYAPFQTARRKGRDAQRVVEMKNLYSSILLYADSHGSQYPETIEDLQAAQADRLPPNTNMATTTGTHATTYLPFKYNYTSYSDSSGNVLGFHLYTHLETRSPALEGAARCYSYSNNSASSTACIVSPQVSSAAGIIEPTNGTGSGQTDFTSDRTNDTDSKCATDTGKCMYDLRG